CTRPSRSCASARARHNPFCGNFVKGIGQQVANVNSVVHTSGHAARTRTVRKGLSVKYARRPGRLGKVLLAVAIARAGFGIATAVQADIPDGTTIYGCYGKPGTPYRGQLRVRDADQGEACRFYENPISWSVGSSGPTGVGNTYYGNGEVASNDGGGVTIAS